jgi:hypothetical protein
MQNLHVDESHLTAHSPDLERHLAQLVEHLARRRVFLTYTDHLTDGELFSLLVDVVTERAPTGLVAIEHDTHTILPCLDFDKELSTFLAIYADEAFRAGWTRDWPDDPMPPRMAMVANRDAFLPGPEPEEQRLAA